MLAKIMATSRPRMSMAAYYGYSAAAERCECKPVIREEKGACSK